MIQRRKAIFSGESENWHKRMKRLTRPIWLGNLRRTSPLSESWGLDRGMPIDRYYIESFLDQYRQDIKGRVLEVKDNSYTNKFGIGVTQSDVIDIDSKNKLATFVADLAAADSLPSDSFDCFVFTQTLQFIYDLEDAIRHVHRILRPNGVLLATVPGISRVERAYATGDYWRFTPASCERILRKTFANELDVQPYGNVLAAIGFLTGMAREELDQTELDARDPYFPVIIAIRAMKRI